MDKRITPQGILRSEKRVDKKHTQNQQSNRKECKEKFKIDKNEFPSLNEISDKCSSGKNPLEFKPSSYSEKLKNVPDKSKTSLKFESAHDSPRSEPIFATEESAVGTSKKIKSSNLPSPSVDSGFINSCYSNRNNTGTSKPSIDQSNDRKVPTHHSANKRLPFGKKDIPEHKEDSSLERSWRAKLTSDRTVNSHDAVKTQYPHQSSKLDNAKGYERNPAVKSNLQNEKSSASTSSTTNATRPAKNISISQDKVGVVPEQNPPTGEGKKKKKRKSKVKRQAALQAGKILVLTPELHSRILNQSNVTHPKQNQYVVTNINDSEEYPELGSSVKTNKENAVKVLGLGSKDSIHPENDLETKQNDLNSTLPTSSTDSDVIIKDQEKIAKPQEKEKAPVLLKDPISVSIFDMLQNAVTKKKDTSRKDETTRLESAVGNVNSTRVIGKKGIPSAVNPLDASRPTIKRGKEREKPKVKKPSRMRKLILIGRQLRKEEMENCEDAENTDAAYTSLSDECLSPSKISCPVKSSFVQNNESSPKSLSFSAEDNFEIETNVSAEDDFEIESNVSAEDDFEIESNVSAGDPIPSVHATETSSCKLSLEETDVCFSTDNSLKNVVNDNFFGHSTKFVELESNAAVKELKNMSHSDKSSDELNLRPIKKLNSETMKSACDDKLSNDGDNSSPILKAMQVKTSNESMFSAEARPMVNFVKMENKTELDLLSINTKVTNAVQKDIATFDVQENVLETESFIPEISCDNLQMIENSSNQLMSLMKNITLNPKVTDELKIEAVKTLIHTRKFRKYCNHFICKGIDEVVFALLDDLARFQDRMHQKDPVKARIRKRLLYGIKEIKRHMKLKKLKGIILATDIEDIKTEGGLNDVVNEIITLAEAHHIPCIFSHRRFNLGKVCRKGVPVSCVGIFNYEGSEKNFKRIIELQEECKLDYLTVTNALSEVLSCDEVTEVLRLGKGVPEKLQEIRTALLKEHFKVESKQHDSESAKSLKDSKYKESLKESNLFETEEIDKQKIHDILLKYNLL